MTNAERDNLLISVATNLNTLQNTVNDMRKEFKQALKESEERTKAELRTEIKASAENTKAELRAEIKASAENTKAELRAEIKAQTNNAIQKFSEQNAADVTECLHTFFGIVGKKNEELNNKIININERLEKKRG